MYKLLALDMDGTTLTSDKKITPQTIDGINRLIKSGVHVVVSSGRALTEITIFKEEFKNMHYGILISGGMIYDFFEDKPISVHRVPFEECINLIELGEAEQAMVHLLTIRDSVAKPQDIANMSDFQMGVYTDMFSKICVQCADLKKYAIEHKDTIVKVNIYHRTPESRERTVAKLKGHNLQMVYAETTALEASPPSVTKAAGLIELCKYLNIDIADTVAIGDAPNDTEVLQTAGYAVAMGNASDDIKKIADYITDDNDHDGVLKAINKIFENYMK